MKKLFSLLTLALLTTSVWAGNTYVKVTSADQLEAGKTYIVVNDEAAAFMGSITTFAAAVTGPTITDGVVTLAGDEGILELTLGGTAGAWTLTADGTNYLAYTGTKNTLTTGTDANETSAQWTATEKDGGFILTNVANTERVLQYNNNSGQERFACYKGTMKDANLYVEDENGTPVVTVAAPTFSPAACNFDESITVTLTAEDGATISYSTDGLAWNTYSTPIVLTATTTIYAKAAKNGVESNVVSATYTLNEPLPEGTIVFNCGTDIGDGSTTRAPWTVVKDGVTMACSDGTVYEGQNYRIYKSATLTFTSTVGAITKIEFDGISGYAISNMTVNVGNLATDGNNGTWTGNATEVVFTATSAQTRATEIRVYIDGEAPAVSAPEFDPAGCVFTGSQQVALSCETEGAAIYYSINDGDYQLYSSPFTLTETAVVKAYAELNGTQSSINSATYTKRVEVTNVADANALDNKVDFIYYGDAAVSYQWFNTKNQYYSTWIVDAQGNAGLIYGKQVPALNQGDVLEEEWEAQKTTYNGIPEFQYPNNVAASGNTWEINPVELTTVTTADVNKYIIMKGQTITADATDTTGLRFINADSLVIYNQFGVTLPAFEEGKTYDVIAIATIYHNAPELYIISATEVQGQDVLRGDVNQDQLVNISDVTALIDILLSGAEAPAEADCNNDQNVNISDVTALIDYLLSGNWPE